MPTATATTLLITGAHGQLGHCFQELAPQYPGWRFLWVDIDELDITDRRAVSAFFDRHAIHWCVNCAAYAAVDKAESEAEKARLVNVTGARNLSDACAKKGIPFVHFSTDYVYHGRQNVPWREDDPVSPKGVYARTKLAGDRAALKANPLAMVIRTSWLYSRYGQNFLRTMLRLGAERPEVRVVFDQCGTPTWAADLAAAVLQIIRKVENQEVPRAVIAGIWHYSNEGVTSWYDFAHAIFDIQKFACRAVPIESKDYPTPVERPPFSVLNKGKIKAAFGLEIPHWREALERCLGEIAHNA